MALTTDAWKAELQAQIGEEIIATYLYFQTTGTVLEEKAPEELAIGVVTHWILNAGAFGSNCTLKCVKASHEGSEIGWSWEVLADRAGTAASESILELCHARVQIVSEEINEERTRMRPQLFGVPKDTVTDGRMTNAQASAIQVFYQQLINPGLSYVGGTAFFQLACRHQNPGPNPSANLEFRKAEAVGVSPFVGSRIDRVRNRPNTGRTPREVAP
jgi:hypothetical protein